MFKIGDAVRSTRPLRGTAAGEELQGRSIPAGTPGVISYTFELGYAVLFTVDGVECGANADSADLAPR